MTRTGNNVFTSKAQQDVNQDHPATEVPSLSDELMQLTDDFAEFGDISAFMCNAFANALKEQEWLNPEIISGARICSGWLQQKTGELKDDIRHVHARYSDEHKEEGSVSTTTARAPDRDAHGHSADDYFF